MIQTTSDGAPLHTAKQFQDVRDTAETGGTSAGEITAPSQKANQEGEFGSKGKPTSTDQ